MPAAVLSRRGLAVTAGLIICVFSGSASAQQGVADAMPPGWQELGAADFLAAARIATETAGDSADRSVVSAHAWRVFLSDANFVAQAELNTVAGLIELFGQHRPNQEELITLEQLQQQYLARLDGEASLLPVMDLFELENVGDALLALGQTRSGNVPMFLQWKAANDWKSLDTPSVYNLYSLINIDAVDRSSFSARWTGAITAPRAGEYTFEQIRVYRGVESQLRLWVGGQLILDTSGEADGVGKSFESQAVQLSAGQPTEVRVELTHDAPYINYSIGAPMALLTWSGPGISRQIIPTDVLSPPSGSAAGSETGLLGEYFADQAFTDLKVTRIDPTLDMVWSWPPAAATETEASREVFAEITSRLLDGGYLNRVAQESDEVVALEFDNNLWKTAYRMSATERLRLVEVLRNNPAVLRRMSPEAIGRLYRGIYMLPGDSKIDLIGEWAMLHDQPRSQAGWYPGWGEGGYQKLNTDFYWAIGYMMQGPYAEDVEKLCGDYLERPDGECCLRVAYIAAYANAAKASRVRNTRSATGLLGRLRTRLDDEATSGDQRVTWLLARAFLDEVLRSDGLVLRPGSEYLDEARLVAESDDYRFWAVQERASRFAALGDTDAVDGLIEEAHAATDSQRRVADSWREVAAAQRSTYLKQQEEMAEKKVESIRQELERRRDVAQGRGRQASADRYQVLIDRLGDTGE